MRLASILEDFLVSVTLERFGGMRGTLTDHPRFGKHDFRAFQNGLVTCSDDKNRRDAYGPVATQRDATKCGKCERKSVNPASGAQKTPKMPK